jgi:CO/xanthine dehydrogenase Mo-binding subunit
MFQFTLNGKNVAVDADKNLLEYLREDARGTSVKDGCAEGVCGSCSVLVNGKAVRACTLSVACMGQGIATVVVQIVVETTGLDKSLLTVHAPDTMVTPDSGSSTASGQTTITGEAARRAANALKQELSHHALAELQGQEFYGEYDCVTDRMTSDKANRVSHVAYGYATQVVVLDREGRVQKVVAAHDVGRAINPDGVEGQIEGGVAMGMGYALTEEFRMHNGAPAVTYGTLGLLCSTQTPVIECRIIEKNQADLAYGAKGVGESVSIPTAPAIACAYWQRDGKLRTSLPLKETPYSRRPDKEGASKTC